MVTNETSRENTKLFFINNDNKEILVNALYQYKRDNNLEYAIIYKQTILFEAKKDSLLDLDKCLKLVQHLFLEFFESDLMDYTIYNKEYQKIKIKVNRIDFN